MQLISQINEKKKFNAKFKLLIILLCIAVDKRRLIYFYKIPNYANRYTQINEKLKKEKFLFMRQNTLIRFSIFLFIN